MDTKNWRPSADHDWRAQLPRRMMVMYLMKNVNSLFPFYGEEGLEELKKMALQFEGTICTAAMSKFDYMEKMLLMEVLLESTLENTFLNSSPSNPSGSNNRPPDSGASYNMQPQVHNQGQPHPMPMSANQSQAREQILSENIPSNMGSTGVHRMQNISEVLQSSEGNSMGRGVPSNINNPQREMPGTQHVNLQEAQRFLLYLYQQLPDKSLLRLPAFLQKKALVIQKQLARLQNDTNMRQNQVSGQQNQHTYLSSLQQTSLGPLQANITNFLSQSRENMLQQNTPLQSNPNMLQHEHLKQQQEHMVHSQQLNPHQMQQQLMQQEMLKQQQFNRQAKQQLPAQMQAEMVHSQQLNEHEMQQQFMKQQMLQLQQQQMVHSQQLSQHEIKQQFMKQQMLQQQQQEMVHSQQLSQHEKEQQFMKQQMLQQHQQEMVHSQQLSQHEKEQQFMKQQMLQQQMVHSQQLSQHEIKQQFMKQQMLQQQMVHSQQLSQHEKEQQFMKQQMLQQHQQEMVHSQQLSQHEKEQQFMKQQMLQRQMVHSQQLSQHELEQQFMKQQMLQQQKLAAEMQAHQIPQLHQRDDVDEPDVFQQHVSKVQHAFYTREQMIAGAYFPTFSPQLFQAASPHSSQHSSPEDYQQYLLSSPTKSELHCSLELQTLLSSSQILRLNTLLKRLINKIYYHL